ncbi:uncharacterized protein B0J16DRAFT_348674 [Fusarium flagelliforme]|uniref:uncharacterized protein n=1 Tax=Fusarium flagelliforme TaxID=2675880 RepID=UPI001E8CDAD6|nr:uncharacterized protein B0J16DRAFT_348674 [Fusarium flagelliforme]KAH7174466.1 hypothetical protein B0J16DRAFT_348674 [Fusarium flagelliforme]
MSPNVEPSVGNVDSLETQHRQAFENALMRVLNTEVAEETFAEIIDGLPTAGSFSEFHWTPDTHPSRDHGELCPGMVERAREFRANFKATMLDFELPLLSIFSDTIVGSKTFHLRLLELLAVSCHQIAVHLYKLDGVNHPHHEYQKWVDEPRDTDKWDSNRRHPTPFCHRAYTNIDQYPNGAADTVGYWAEAKIFGGVLVFDRGESEIECKELYLHAGLLDGPYTLFPLTEGQFETLIKFLLHPLDTDVPENPLPLRATSENRWRWSAWDAIAEHHIFRDRYERRVARIKPRPNYRSSVDWPENADEFYLINAWYDYSNGEPVDKERIRKALENLKQITPSSPCWPGGPSRHPWTNVLFEETTNGSDHTTEQA